MGLERMALGLGDELFVGIACRFETAVTSDQAWHVAPPFGLLRNYAVAVGAL